MEIKMIRTQLKRCEINNVFGRNKVKIVTQSLHGVSYQWAVTNLIRPRLEFSVCGY